MHNGIGLATPRGTATNGFVQRNLAYRRDRVNKRVTGYEEELEAPKVRKPNKEILEHQRKRNIELKLLEWAEETKVYDNHTEDEAEQLMADKRKELTELQEQGKLIMANDQAKETHQRSAAKEKELERFRQAMKIDRDYEPGNAFNEEYQQAKKNKRYEQVLEREKRKYLELKEGVKAQPAERRRRYSRSPPRRREYEREERRYRKRSSSRSISPRSPPRSERRRDDSRSPRRSRSRRDHSSSPIRSEDSLSPVSRRRRRDDSVSPPRSERSSRKRSRSRSRSPRRYRSRGSPSPSEYKRRRYRSPSPR